MAPLPPNNTIRFFVDYSQAFGPHTAVIRTNGLASPANIGTLVDAILTSLGPLIMATTIDVVRFAAAGSNISNPVTTGIEGNTYGAGSGSTFTAATSLNFVGRSSGGRRCRFELFGYESSVSDFRVTEAESTEVTAALATIRGAANSFLAIDNVKPVWYPYANVSINAYWQRKYRV